MIATEVCASWTTALLASVLAEPYRVALIRPDPKGSYGALTTNWAELGGDEVQGAGYTKGGAVLRNPRVVMRDLHACLHFDDVRWVGADFVAAGALIHGTGGRAVAVLAFGSTFAVVGGGEFLLPIDCPVRL